MEQLASNKSFGGWQQRFEHDSSALNCRMRFSVYLPPQAEQESVPVLYWLSGLTCNDENFVQKAGAQRCAAELGLAIVAPDTSPRGDDVADDPDGAWDFGLGAGFYVNATEQPWARHYHMYDYIAQELPALVEQNFPVDGSRTGIFGHSMGGHGALTIGLKHPERFRSISAFAPIAAPTQCAWGEKALSGYLGDDRSQWQSYDACALIHTLEQLPQSLLVDQGGDDNFLSEQLRPELLQQACEARGLPLSLRLQPGYDHSYFFIASFIEDHLRYHASLL